MKPTINFFVLTVLLYSSATEATRCPVCGYISGIPDDQIPDELKFLLDESCKDGNTPNNNVIRTCMPYPEPFDNAELVCGTGSVKQTENNELTIRGCIPLVNGLQKGCQDITKADLLRIPGLTDEVRQAIGLLPDGFTAQLCISEGTSGGGGDGDSAGSYLKNSAVLLWALPILCLISKYF